MSYKLIKGFLNNSDAKVTIVVAEFNSFVTNALLEGCLSTLKYSGGVKEENITVVKVPGAFEIPFAIKKAFMGKNTDVCIALGAVIRGSTPHFDYVCGPMSSQIMQLSLEFNKPVSFGVLTTNTIDEAFERCGTKAGNKGSEAAIVALEMLSISEQEF